MPRLKTVGNADEKVIADRITFRTDELLAFMWNLYARTRIEDVISDMPQFANEPDPMASVDAQQELIESWAKELAALRVRRDGSVKFTGGIWLVPVHETPNAGLSCRPQENDQ